MLSTVTTTALGLRAISTVAVTATATTSALTVATTTNPRPFIHSGTSNTSNSFSTLCPPLGLRSAALLHGCNSTKLLRPTTAVPLLGATPFPMTSRTESTVASPSSRPPSSTTGDDKVELNWTDFFKLRKSRRRYQLAASMAGSLTSSMGGATLLASPLGDGLLAQVPLDPFIGFGLGITLFLALGWLVGPTVGNACFYIMNSRWRSQMTAKEAEFFARIKKNRVDPAVSSAGNPGTSPNYRWFHAPFLLLVFLGGFFFWK